MYPNTTKKKKEKRKRNIDLAVLPSYDKIKGISSIYMRNFITQN